METVAIGYGPDRLAGRIGGLPWPGSLRHSQPRPGPDLSLPRPAPTLGEGPEGWQYHAGPCPLQRGDEYLGRAAMAAR